MDSLLNETLALELQRYQLTADGSWSTHLARLCSALFGTMQHTSNESDNGSSAPSSSLTEESVCSLVQDELSAALQTALARLPLTICNNLSLEDVPQTPSSELPAPALMPLPLARVSLLTSLTPQWIVEHVFKGEIIGFNDLLPEVLATSST